MMVFVSKMISHLSGCSFGVQSHGLPAGLHRAQALHQNIPKSVETQSNKSREMVAPPSSSHTRDTSSALSNTAPGRIISSSDGLSRACIQFYSELILCKIHSSPFLIQYHFKIQNTPAAARMAWSTCKPGTSS